MLQVTVHHEADAGVERQMRRLPCVAIGVQWQILLEIQEQDSPEKPEEIDCQECFQETFPTHLHIRVDAAQPENKTFHRSHEVQPGLLSFIYFCDVHSQRIRQNDHQYYLRDATY